MNGCYAGVGPSVGFVPRSRTPTLGWEASAASFTFAKSYALTPVSGALSQRHQAWSSRSYMFWEPRIGAQVFEGDPRFFLGGGPSIGVQWTHDASLPEADFGLQAGGWGGGVWPIDPTSPGSNTYTDLCERNDRVYVSFAIGARGDELYFTPKLGWMKVPATSSVCFVNRRR